MTDLSPYIKQLLYRNDCVILPKFGGIMAQYASAQVHPIQNIFRPPFKTLAFNKSLTHNDGLLVSEIVRFTWITYEAADISIHQFVRKLENDLSGKGQAIINGVGKFYFDIEHNLLFEPSEGINFLTNAYGLEQFVAKPILRNSEINHQFINAPVKKKSRTRFSWAGFGVALVFILIALQIIIVSNDFKPFDLNKSDILNSITSGFKSNDSNAIGNEINNRNDPVKHETTTHRNDTLVQIIVIQQPVDPIIESAKKILSTETENSTTDFAKLSNSKYKASIADAISLALSNLHSDESNYYVVFACLKSQTKSDLFIEQMRLKGIEVSLLFKDSYYRIGIGGFNTSDEAMENMRDYRKQGVADVWVMKK